MELISSSSMYRTLGLQNLEGASQNSEYVRGTDWTGVGWGSVFFARNSENRCLSSMGAAGCGWGASGADVTCQRRKRTKEMGGRITGGIGAFTEKSNEGSVCPGRKAAERGVHRRRRVEHGAER